MSESLFLGLNTLTVWQCCHYKVKIEIITLLIVALLKNNKKNNNNSIADVWLPIASYPWKGKGAKLWHMCAWSQWTGKNFFSAKPTTSCSQDVDLSDFVLFLKIKSELWTQWKIHKNTVLKVAQCFKWDNETKDFHCLLYTDHTSTLKPLTGHPHPPPAVRRSLTNVTSPTI